MNYGQISGHLPGFAHFQKPGFDQQKPSIYAGLRRFKKSFDNNLITAIQEPLFLQPSGLRVTE